MEPSKFVMQTVMSVAAHFAQRGISLTVEKAKELIEKILQRNPGLRAEVDMDAVTKEIEATISPWRCESCRRTRSSALVVRGGRPFHT